MTTPPATLQALVFDVDGTLAETERDGHRVAFNQAFRDAGLGWNWSPERYGELLAITGGKERIAHFWQSVDPAAPAAAGFGARVRALHERKTEHYLGLVERCGIALRPGVAALIHEARRRGLRLAIATTTTEANVRGLLDAALGPGTTAVFEVIGAGDVVARKKPAPDIYRHVLERLGLAPEAALAFEDSAAGVAAARAAGLPTVLVRGDYTRHEPIAGALADLDGWGTPEQPARGTVRGAPWTGRVTVDVLTDWWSALRVDSGTGSATDSVAGAAPGAGAGAAAAAGAGASADPRADAPARRLASA